jgi:Tfp pilus assembly protein PilV
MNGHRRSGFSLMEVLLASGMLLASLVVLGQMAGVGRRHAEDAESLTTAQLLCLARLNAILAGASGLQSQAATAIPEAPGWTCEVAVQPQGQFGLVSVQVTVRPEADEGGRRRGKSFSLVRWMHQPQAAGSEASATQFGMDSEIPDFDF